MKGRRKAEVTGKNLLQILVRRKSTPYIYLPKGWGVPYQSYVNYKNKVEND